MTTEAVNQAISSFWPGWTIQWEIGAGSYGTVYRAVFKDGSAERFSAIKVISIPENQAEVDAFMSSVGANELTTRAYYLDFVKQYINEVNIMESLKDVPGIVHIEASVVQERKDAIGFDIFIRMELLTSFVKFKGNKQPFSQDQAISLGLDLCSALESCAKLNIIHRDIKPENIFVAPDGSYKLGDFGVARRLERKVSPLSHKGTYNYMAPEVYKGSEYTENVDVYSLGIVLYCLMNRDRAPFLATDKQLLTYPEREEALERRMSGEELPPPADAGEALSAVILKACRYDPKERYSNAAEMAEALKKARISIDRGENEEKRFARKIRRSLTLKSRKKHILAGCVLAAAIVGLAISIPVIHSRTSSGQTAAEVSSSFDMSGLKDHVMSWNDEALAAAMEKTAGIPAAEIHLSDVWTMEKLNLDCFGIKDISALAELTNLRSLSLSDNNISDIKPLENLSGLTYLNLDSNSISDISALSGLKQLKTLHMEHNKLKDTGSLKDLPCLKALYLADNEVSSAGSLDLPENLETLSLGGNHLGSADAVFRMTKLRFLDISDTGISSLEGIDALSELKELYAGNNDISDPAPLGSLSGLTYLDLQDNPIGDITFLADFGSLEILDLENCGISDISVLKNQTGLKYLALGNNDLSDISSLSDLKDLKYLDLKANDIKDASYLASLVKLEHLNLSGNALSGSLDFLSEMKTLNYLDIRNNMISDISALAGLTGLRYLYLTGNPIEDTSVLGQLDPEELEF